MDKMLYKILFSLEPSNRNTGRPAPSKEKEKEREIGSKKGIGPEVGGSPPSCTVRSLVRHRERSPCGGRFLLHRPPFSRDCTYLHGIPNGDSPMARVAGSRGD